MTEFLRYDVVAEALLPCSPALVEDTNLVKLCFGKTSSGDDENEGENQISNHKADRDDVTKGPFEVKEVLGRILKDIDDECLVALRHIRDQLWRAASILDLSDSDFVKHVRSVCKMFAEEKDLEFISPRKFSLAVDLINAPISHDLFRKLVRPFSVLISADFDALRSQSISTGLDETGMYTVSEKELLAFQDAMQRRRELLPYKAILTIVLRPPKKRETLSTTTGVPVPAVPGSSTSVVSIAPGTVASFATTGMTEHFGLSTRTQAVDDEEFVRTYRRIPRSIKEKYERKSIIGLPPSKYDNMIPQRNPTKTFSRSSRDEMRQQFVQSVVMKSVFGENGPAWVHDKRRNRSSSPTKPSSPAHRGGASNRSRSSMRSPLTTSYLSHKTDVDDLNTSADSAVKAGLNNTTINSDDNVGDDGKEELSEREAGGGGGLAVGVGGGTGYAGRNYLESVYRGWKCNRKLRRESLELAKEMVLDSEERTALQKLKEDLYNSTSANLAVSREFDSVYGLVWSSLKKEDKSGNGLIPRQSLFAALNALKVDALRHFSTVQKTSDQIPPDLRPTLLACNVVGLPFSTLMKVIDYYALNPRNSRFVGDNDSDDGDDGEVGDASVRGGTSVSSRRHSSAGGGNDAHSVMSGGVLSVKSGGHNSVATGMTGMTGMTGLTGRLTARSSGGGAISSAAGGGSGSEANLGRERQRELERLRSLGILDRSTEYDFDDDNDGDGPGGYRRPPPPCVVDVLANSPSEGGDELIVFHTPLKTFLRRLERRNEGKPLYGCGCGAGRRKDEFRSIRDDDDVGDDDDGYVGEGSGRRKNKGVGRGGGGGGVDRSSKYIHIDDFLALLFETHFDGLVMDVATPDGPSSPETRGRRAGAVSSSPYYDDGGGDSGRGSDVMKMSGGGTLTRAKPFKRSQMSRKLDQNSVRDAQLLVSMFDHEQIRALELFRRVLDDVAYKLIVGAPQYYSVFDFVDEQLKQEAGKRTTGGAFNSTTVAGLTLAPQSLLAALARFLKHDPAIYFGANPSQKRTLDQLVQTHRHRVQSTGGFTFTYKNDDHNDTAGGEDWRRRAKKTHTKSTHGLMGGISEDSPKLSADDFLALVFEVIL